MSLRAFVAASFIIAIACAVSVRPSMAQTAGIAVENPNVRNAAGLAVGIAPDYMGSDEYTVGIAPTAIYHWNESERFAKLVATEFSVNLIDDENWRLGPILNYRFGRDDVDDEVVDRLRDIDDTVEGGIFGGWTLKNEVDPRYRISLQGQVLHDLGDEHEGLLATVSARYWFPVARPLILSVGVSTTYADDDYMQTYFGITEADSIASGLTQYNAGSGVRDVRFSPVAIFSFSENWHLAGGVVISQLLGDASDSPVVDDRGSDTQIYAGAGVIYAW